MCTFCRARIPFLNGSRGRHFEASFGAPGRNQGPVDFLSEVGTRLKAVFPPTGDVTFFPMPRLFFVATRRTDVWRSHSLRGGAE